MRGRKYKVGIANYVGHLGSVTGERNQVLKERAAIWWKANLEPGKLETSKPMAIWISEYVTICEKGHRLALMKTRWRSQKGIWGLRWTAWQRDLT